MKPKMMGGLFIMDGEENKEVASEFEQQLRAVDSNIEELAEAIRALERRLEKALIADGLVTKNEEKSQKQLSPISTHLRSCNERLRVNIGYISGILSRLDL